jgi:hypothetical protein
MEDVIKYALTQWEVINVHAMLDISYIMGIHALILTSVVTTILIIVNTIAITPMGAMYVIVNQVISYLTD